MHAVPYLTLPAAGAARSGGPTSLAMSLAAHPERWLPLLDGTRRCRLLGRGGDFADLLAGPSISTEVWLLSWLPGQHAGLHDHGRASGAFAVAAGTLVEDVAPPHSDRAPVEITRRLTAGSVRAFGPHYRHRVSNTGTVPAVSVHVYAHPPRATGARE